MILTLLYIAIGALANKIRGGLLNRFYHNQMLWKIVATVIIAVSTHFLLAQPIIASVLISAAWFGFLIYEWGAWFDIAQLDPQYERGGILRPIYLWLGSRFGQRTTDQVMMFIRGLFSLILFATIGLITGNWAVLYLTPLLAFFWTLAYVIDRAWINPFLNIAEYLAGAVIAIFIVIALKM